MKPLKLKCQYGLALLLFVLMLMGIGGFVLVGYSQGLLKQVEVSKTEHNTRVLNKAKLALLQFAYNYPVLSTPSIGPGRLPNADTDNDGIADGGSTFGRLPWAQANLNLYDIRDADGERLWYAVSSTFRPQAASVNSDTSGNLTLRDQQGNVIYDGSNPGGLAQYGIAAVIIAPGAVTARNGAAQDRSIANENNSVHYLDLVFGTEDNATRTLGSPTDGFILGPVDTLSTDAVNDQFIVITAAEVIAMAEKATLQAYRTAISDYLTRTGNVYPWLYNYVVPAIEPIDSYYPVNAVWATEVLINLVPGNIGRIPTIFGDYFTEFESQSIDTELYGSVDITYPSGLTYNQIEFEGNPVPGAGDFSFNDGFTPPFYLTGVPDVEFTNIAVNQGQLTTTFAAAEPPVTLDLYFWDDDEGAGTGFYTPCGDDGDGIPELTDCHRADLATPTPGSASTVMKLFILHIQVTLGWAATPGAVNFDLDYTPHCEYEVPDGEITEAGCLSAPTPGKWFPNIEIVPATADSHAIIMATFHASHVINGTMPALTGALTYEECPHYHSTYTPAEFNKDDCSEFSTGTVDLVDFSVNELTLGIRYYPELPQWAFDNGWHDSIMMAYAQDYRPDTPVVPCTEGTDCIQINNFAGNNDNKISILTIAGQHGWVDEGADGFTNDVGDVFDVENDDLDRFFDARANPGNDKILIVEEL